MRGFGHAEYIASETWRLRREAYYEGHARRCTCCDSSEAVDLHHLSYFNAGNEPDEDLMPLCERCHAWAHRTHRQIGGSLAKATRIAIADLRRPRIVPTKRLHHNYAAHEPNAILFAAVREAQSKRVTA